jgi:iron(III) transport system permease protein
MINQFEAQMQIECAAVVSLMILIANLIIKGTAHILKKRRLAKV